MKNKKNIQAGFSLIELLVAMTILGVVLAGVSALFTRTGRYHTGQEMLVEVAQNIRSAKNLMVDEIRSAGCNPEGTVRIGFELDKFNDRFNTDANSIHFTRDIDNEDLDELYEPDGVVGTNENIRYYRRDGAGNVLNPGDPTVGTLVRLTGSGAGIPQPVVNNIVDLEFKYFDEANVEIAPATMTKNSVLSKIRTVEVTLVGQVQNTSRVNAGNQNWEQKFRIRVRNL